MGNRFFQSSRYFDTYRHTERDKLVPVRRREHKAEGDEGLQDYREQPFRSPCIWCIVCKALRSSDGAVRVMRTAFHVCRDGIYPYGVCNRHLGTAQDRGD